MATVTERVVPTVVVVVVVGAVYTLLKHLQAVHTDVEATLARLVPALEATATKFVGVAATARSLGCCWPASRRCFFLFLAAIVVVAAVPVVVTVTVAVKEMVLESYLLALEVGAGRRRALTLEEELLTWWAW